RTRPAQSSFPAFAITKLNASFSAEHHFEYNVARVRTARAAALVGSVGTSRTVCISLRGCRSPSSACLRAQKEADGLPSIPRVERSTRGLSQDLPAISRISEAKP